eukprot:2510316-Amphidinium_carterae.1
MEFMPAGSLHALLFSKTDGGPPKKGKGSAGKRSSPRQSLPTRMEVRRIPWVQLLVFVLYSAFSQRLTNTEMLIGLRTGAYLSFAFKAGMALQVAEGLAYLHALSVVH